MNHLKKNIRYDEISNRFCFFFIYSFFISNDEIEMFILKYSDRFIDSNVEEFECLEIKFCGSEFDEEEKLSKSMRYRFDEGWVESITIFVVEELVILEDFVVISSCTWSERVLNKKCNFWPKTIEWERSWDICKLKLASFI